MTIAAGIQLVVVVLDDVANTWSAGKLTLLYGSDHLLNWCRYCSTETGDHDQCKQHGQESGHTARLGHGAHGDGFLSKFLKKRKGIIVIRRRILVSSIFALPV